MKKKADAAITFRLPGELRQKANAKADERGESLSDVLRAALERYVAKS